MFLRKQLRIQGLRRGIVRLLFYKPVATTVKWIAIHLLKIAALPAVSVVRRYVVRSLNSRGEENTKRSLLENWKRRHARTDDLLESLVASVAAYGSDAMVRFGIPFSTLSSALAGVVSFLKSRWAQDMVEGLIDSLDLPSTCASIVETLALTIFSSIRGIINNTLSIEGVDLLLKRFGAKTLDIKAFAVAEHLPEISRLLTKIVRKNFLLLAHLVYPTTAATLKIGIPAIKELVIDVYTQAVNKLESRLFTRPERPPSQLLNYVFSLISDGSILSDEIGPKVTYEALVAIFFDRDGAGKTLSLRAYLEAAKTRQDENRPLLLMHQILSSTLLYVGTAERRTVQLAIQDRWEIRTSSYAIELYGKERVAVTGCHGELRLLLPATQDEGIVHTFYITAFLKGIGSETTATTADAVLSYLSQPRRKGIWRSRRVKTCTATFSFSRSTERDWQAVITLQQGTRPKEENLQLSVRFKPLLLRTLKDKRVQKKLSKSIQLAVQQASRSPSPQVHTGRKSSFPTDFPLFDLYRYAREYEKTVLAAGVLQTLLEYELYSQKEWFATDFSIHVEMTSAVESPSVELVLAFGDKKLAKKRFRLSPTRMSDLLRLKELEKMLCNRAVVPLRALGRIDDLRSQASSKKTLQCARRAELTITEEGQQQLRIIWYSGKAIDSATLEVVPLNDPDMSEAVALGPESTLSSAWTTRLQEWLSNTSVELQEGPFGRILPWATAIVHFEEALLNAFYRRHRLVYSQSLQQSTVNSRRLSAQATSICKELFERDIDSKSINPMWSIRLDMLLKQQRHATLEEALGPERSLQFKQAVARDLSLYQGASQTASAAYCAAASLEKENIHDNFSRIHNVCSAAVAQNPEAQFSCEKTGGLWGSVRLSDPASPLNSSIGLKQMDQPALFKYWHSARTSLTSALPKEHTKAKYAIADLSELQTYVQQERADVSVVILQPNLPHLKWNLELYNAELADARTAEGAHNSIIELIEYFYLSLLETLERFQRVSAVPEFADLASVARAAGAPSIQTIAPRGKEVISAAEATAFFAEAEESAERFYRELGKSVRPFYTSRLLLLPLSIPPRPPDATPGHYLIVEARLLTNNPFVSGAGYQTAFQRKDISSVCSGEESSGRCIHHSILWNHLYVTLLVLYQFTVLPEVAQECAALLDFSLRGLPNHKEPINFEQAVTLFQYGLKLVVKWKLNTPGSHAPFRRPLDLTWIKQLLAMFEDDITFTQLVLRIPPISLEREGLRDPKEMLQKAVWNAVTTLWSLRDAYGRLDAQVRSVMLRASPHSTSAGFASVSPPPYKLPPLVREELVIDLSKSFQKWISAPPTGSDEMRQHRIENIWRQPEAQLLIDGYISAELVPSARRTGKTQASSSPERRETFFNLLRKRLGSNQTSNPEITWLQERLQESEVRESLDTVFSDAALKAAMVEQLSLSGVVVLLTRRDQLFRIDNRAKLVENFLATGTMHPEAELEIQRLFPYVCEAIPATHYDEKLAGFGFDVYVVSAFRLQVVQLRQVLYDLDVGLSREQNKILRHHPLHKHIVQNICHALIASDGPSRQLERIFASNARLIAACDILEKARQKVLETTGLPTTLPSAVAKRLVSGAEKLNCVTTTRDGALLEHFFVRGEMKTVETSALATYLTTAATIRMNRVADADLHALEENLLAAGIHLLVLREKAASLPVEAIRQLVFLLCELATHYSKKMKLVQEGVDLCITAAPALPVIEQVVHEAFLDHLARMRAENSFVVSGETLGSPERQSGLSERTNLIHTAATYLSRAMADSIKAVVNPEQKSSTSASTPIAGTRLEPPSASTLHRLLKPLLTLIGREKKALMKLLKIGVVRVMTHVQRILGLAVEKAFSSVYTMLKRNVKEDTLEEEVLQIQQKLRAKYLDLLPASSERLSQFAIERHGTALPPSRRKSDESEPRGRSSSYSFVSKRVTQEQNKSSGNTHVTTEGMSVSTCGAHTGGLQEKMTADEPALQSASRSALDQQSYMLTEGSDVSLVDTTVEVRVHSMIKQLIQGVLASLDLTTRQSVYSVLGAELSWVQETVAGNEASVVALRRLYRSVCITCMEQQIVPAVLRGTQTLPNALITSTLDSTSRNMMFAVAPDLVTIEQTLGEAAAPRMASRLVQGLTIQVAQEIAVTLQENKTKMSIAKIINPRVQRMFRALNKALKNVRISEAICEVIGMMVDRLLKAASKSRMSTLGFVSDLFNADLTVVLTDMIQAISRKGITTFLHSEDFEKLLALFLRPGYTNVIFDIGRAVVHVYGREA